MIHLKCTTAHYDNLNSSYINKPYLQAVEYTISFFFSDFLLVYFNEAFAKTFTKKLSFFHTDFQNSIQDLVYYRKLGCQTL